MGVASTRYAAIGAYHDRQQALAFVELNGISQQLLHSAGQWALERGMTNAALNAPKLSLRTTAPKSTKSVRLPVTRSAKPLGVCATFP